MCPSFLLGKILFKQNMNFRMSHSILSEYIYCVIESKMACTVYVLLCKFSLLMYFHLNAPVWFSVLFRIKHEKLWRYGRSRLAFGKLNPFAVGSSYWTRGLCLPTKFLNFDCLCSGKITLLYFIRRYYGGIPPLFQNHAHYIKLHPNAFIRIKALFENTKICQCRTVY